MLQPRTLSLIQEGRAHLICGVAFVAFFILCTHVREPCASAGYARGVIAGPACYVSMLDGMHCVCLPLAEHVADCVFLVLSYSQASHQELLHWMRVEGDVTSRLFCK